ncbi:hypothetical protein P168DRAFT_290157 [Aspergillus campestris IBT 28561]|uniref:CFEM domain-containing protein n=1 Tax=Aspergillus campestris (strain IBT 28561) TaxID=1392248 RepID=A0A2I1D2D5_ASPC2|nr:uncharacterized protein P168DRAFT_290157 [Aspergillus campestris IBT 28561]PKY04027.1 hypothetical protein P168DRAFT_290157 [Aspergillus campestris IBT 28561]
MKLHHISLALVGFLGTAAAQGMNGLPDCAKECATGSIPDTCSMIDIKCICSTKSFLTDISCCVATKCSEDKQKETIEFAHKICSGAGVNDLPQSASCASESSTSTKTSSESTTQSATSTGVTGASSPSATDAEGSSTDSLPTASKSPDSGRSASSPTSSTDAAAVVQSQGMGLFAAAGAALFAFLA